MDNAKTLEIEVAKKIWDIAKISPDHGNTLMDLIGKEAYDKVMRLQAE